MRWEKQENGKWKLLGPSKGKVDPYDPSYGVKLRAQMKKINPYCDVCKALYNLADPCVHHLSDSPEHRARYKAYQLALKKKRDSINQVDTQKKL